MALGRRFKMRAANEASVCMTEQSVTGKSNALPLSFTLEGKSQDLTIVVQATMALWMVGMAFEGGGMLHRFSLPENSFEADLLQYMVYMFVGTLAAALGALALTLNLQITNQDNWKWQDVQSTLALVVIDCIAVYYTQDALRGMISTATSDASKAEWISLVARAFLLLSGVCLIFIFNCLFIREFGCCIWLSNQRAGFQRLLDKNPTWNRIMSRTIDQGVQSEDPPECESLLDRLGSIEQDSLVLFIDESDRGLVPEEQTASRDDCEKNSHNAMDSSMGHEGSQEDIVDQVCEIEAQPLLSIRARSFAQDIDQNTEEDYLVLRYHDLQASKN